MDSSVTIIGHGVKPTRPLREPEADLTKNTMSPNAEMLDWAKKEVVPIVPTGLLESARKAYGDGKDVATYQEFTRDHSMRPLEMMSYQANGGEAAKAASSHVVFGDSDDVKMSELIGGKILFNESAIAAGSSASPDGINFTLSKDLIFTIVLDDSAAIHQVEKFIAESPLAKDALTIPPNLMTIRVLYEKPGATFPTMPMAVASASISECSLGEAMAAALFLRAGGKNWRATDMTYEWTRPMMQKAFGEDAKCRKLTSLPKYERKAKK